MQQQFSQMIDIANEIDNIQQAKRYIQTIPNNLAKSVAMLSLINRLPINEIIKYIKLIPDDDIRDEAILDNIDRIVNFEQKNILIDQAKNINFKSFLMRESARSIHNLQRVKDYITTIPNLDDRSGAMLDFLEDYSHELSLEQKLDYIRRIPNLDMRSNHMDLISQNIQDLEDRQSYILSIPNAEIRERAFQRIELMKQQIREPTQRQLLEKQILSINNFINKFQQKKLPSTITLKGLKTFFNRNKIPHQGLITKQQFQQSLNEFKKQLYQKKIKGQTISPVYQIQQGQDFFGNQIINPVLGDDGEIYDEESLNKWFSNPSNKIWSNQEHDYIINPKNVANPYKKLKKIQKKLTMQQYHQYLKKKHEQSGQR